MANNPYVLDPVFKADTFQEMVAPLTLYAQAYKEQEAKVEDMTDKAAALEWIANQNPESLTAALYRDMSDKIKGIRDDMMINGLMGGTRSRILGARKTYSANSAEIMRRYQDMVKYKDRMDQLHDRDNSIRFSSDSSQVSLDDFAGGNRPKIEAISGNEIMARGAAAGKRFTSQIFGDGVEGKEMSDQFWKVYKQQGMNDDALLAALDSIGKGDKYPMLSKVFNSVYSSFKNFGDNDQQYFKDRFIEGFYSGSMYNRDVQYMQNEDHMNPYENAQIRWGDDQNARANAEEERNKKDWEFANGISGHTIFTTDANGTIVKRGVLYDPYQGKQILIDPETGNAIDSSEPPQKKKKEKPKQPTTKAMAVYADEDGVICNVPKSGTIISPSDNDYYIAISKIKKGYSDVPLEQLSAYYNIYKAHDSGVNKDIYYAVPKLNKPEPEESTQTSSGSGGEEDTVTE